MSLTAPDSVRTALRRALAWIEDGRGGDGLEPATIREAHRLADGEACTLAKARKALRFYARNARYPSLPGFKPNSENYPSPARVSWDLWGGSSGPAFYRSVIRQIKPELLKRDAGPWGDPITDYAEELADMAGISLGWFSEPASEDDPAGDGSREEEGWTAWVLPLMAQVTAATALDVAADSVYATEWRATRSIIIRAVATTTRNGLEAGAEAGLPSSLTFGLTPQQVAGLLNLKAELERRGWTEDRIARRLVAERDALRIWRAELLAETEVIAAHAGATLAAWQQGKDQGLLPVATRKRWWAAMDERTCPVCGFLHMQETGLDAKFADQNGQEYPAPGAHPRCRCKMQLVLPEESMSEAVSRAYTLPEVMTEATAPPVAIAAMGPVALAFFVATFNAHTAAGLPPALALGCAWDSMYGAGFRRQADGTYTRPENWEKEAAEAAKWYEPSGIMRKGKVISAANAKTLMDAHGDLSRGCGKLKDMLRACGYMGEDGMEAPEVEEPEESETERSATRVDAPVQIVRKAKTGDEFWGFASVAAIDGELVEDSHGTNFSVEELGRAMDNVALRGRYLSLDHEHESGTFAGVATQAMVVTPELLEYLRTSGKTGLLIKGRPMDDASRQRVLSGKLSLSIAGRGRVQG